MTKLKPIVVIDEFISPAMCEEIVSSAPAFPNIENNRYTLTTFRNTLAEKRLVDRVSSLSEVLDNMYGTTSIGLTPMEIEWYTAGVGDTSASCASHDFLDGKWKRVNDIMYSAVLFLSSFNDGDEAFDESFEVYGGRLGFPTLNMSLTPEMGRLVVFPALPNFVNGTEMVKAGDLFQMKFNIAVEHPLSLTMENFDMADPILQIQ